MGPGDSLHRTKPPCFLDAQQDHPEGHRELQNHARAEGISADIEDKIKGKIRNRQITMHCPFYHPVQKYHNQKYLWYFCTKITIKLLECIKKERILKVSRTKVPQLKIFVVLLYKN